MFFFKNSLSKLKQKRGQVTIFIIIAIVLVAAIIFYFTLRGNLNKTQIPSSLQAPYTQFLSCLEEQTNLGIHLLEQQGGYIKLPEFEPGSPYSPFSSQLDFAGNPIPYWYYLDYEGKPKEQVPSLSNMESDLGDFINRQIQTCNFDKFYEEEYDINFSQPKASVKILDNKVIVNLDMDFFISKADENTLIKKHKIEVPSSLGILYKESKRLYNLEQKTLFLEKYAIDDLRLYAPVDGVEIECAPKVWVANKVFQELADAIEFNTMALKTKGDSIKTDSDKYFAIDFESNYGVRFLNSKNWVHKFEVNPTQGNLLVAKPVGNSPGLGILGFCYIPYHYVYNIYFPVLAQVYSKEEIFQFPMAVVIQGNKERKALPAVSQGYEEEVCKYPNTLISVKVYDSDLNPINANITYTCLGQICDIGQSKNGDLFFPQCVNGTLTASAKGYADEKLLLSTVDEGSIELIMRKLHKINVDLKLDSKNYNGQALITFISPNSVKTLLYPQQKNVELSEGDYDIQVQIYKNSSLKIGATTQHQCVKVPRSGIAGAFGFTKQECYDIQVPEQLITNVLAGGGKQEFYILESDLASSNSIIINSKSFPVPTSVDKLQENQNLFEQGGLDIHLT